jgi:hypothetical protein
MNKLAAILSTLAQTEGDLVTLYRFTEAWLFYSIVAAEVTTDRSVSEDVQRGKETQHERQHGESQQLVCSVCCK